MLQSVKYLLTTVACVAVSSVFLVDESNADPTGTCHISCSGHYADGMTWNGSPADSMTTWSQCYYLRSNLRWTQPGFCPSNPEPVQPGSGQVPTLGYCDGCTMSWTQTPILETPVDPGTGGPYVPF